MLLKAFTTGRYKTPNGRWNVWDYSGDKTTCVAFNIKADTKEEAVKKAKDIIRNE